MTLNNITNFSIIDEKRKFALISFMCDWKLNYDGLLYLVRNIPTKLLASIICIWSILYLDSITTYWFYKYTNFHVEVLYNLARILRNNKLLPQHDCCSVELKLNENSD